MSLFLKCLTYIALAAVSKVRGGGLFLDRETLAHSYIPHLILWYTK